MLFGCFNGLAPSLCSCLHLWIAFKTTYKCASLRHRVACLWSIPYAQPLCALQCVSWAAPFLATAPAPALAQPRHVVPQ